MNASKAAKHLISFGRSIYLVVAFIFMLLVADIRPYYSFIKSDRKNKIPWSRVTSVQESDVMPLKTTPYTTSDG